ncbi:hypothetical protein [Allorhodopirellula solitaria]|uniref:Cytochrome c domain-containing protein n=1 Tax=Allorhodopirellula solitaria TaxID=2527987 RepID=A0A5C5XU38_9BACT|nr:hypothetical protein [Allorhodopirellula solitaria]TWT66069.1 hypothetical protein CA85_29310 [Allorhodopirellula solitaria]
MNPVRAIVFWGLWVPLSTLVMTSPVEAQFTVDIDIEEPPFQYSETVGENRVTRLMEKLKSKEVELEYTRERGYLESLLAALDIPPSSQTLVFSKTSMQVRHISRRNPRAVYFNDDTYLAWINGSSLVEISTADPLLGAAFYTVDMVPWRANLERQNYDCLACHATSLTQGLPGHTVRSVMPSYDGSFDAQSETFITSDASPFPQRWGGWYVTGIHGEMQHMGNTYVRGGKLDISDNGNRMNLRDDFDTSNYLSPSSDIVALMVLEHQTQMHNTLVRANFFNRQRKYDAEQLDADEQDDAESNAQLQMIASEVVDRLLFREEAKLTDQVRGSVVFAHDFQSRGPFDSQGRSLRNFDLKTRLFQFPCSYLIYSDAFSSLDLELRLEIVRQLQSALTAEPDADDHLSARDRASILEILSETHSDFSRGPAERSVEQPAELPAISGD